MPVVPTGLPLTFAPFRKAAEARKRQYADVVDWAEAKHRVLTDDGLVRLIKFQPPPNAPCCGTSSNEEGMGIYGSGLWCTRQ